MAFRASNFRPTAAIIHLDNLTHNIEVLRKHLPPEQFFCPMVKANAYGHGDLMIAEQLLKSGIRQLGVGLVEEGLVLRQMGIDCEILVYGTFTQPGLLEMLKYDLTPVLTGWDQLERLDSVGVQQIDVHVKFDSGMNRLGFSIKDMQKVFDWFEQRPQLSIAGLMTHLHSAEDLDFLRSESFAQLRRFQPVIDLFRMHAPVVHSLNSAGLIHQIKCHQGTSTWPSDLPQQHCARPGLAIYGYSPLPAEKTPVILKPVMSLRSKVVSIRKLQIGESVSYGASWKSNRPTFVGVVPCGYADGFHRLLSNQSEVLFKGQRVRVVGKVCMDYFMIDLTDVILNRETSEFIGGEVTLFGYDSNGRLLPAQEVASWAQTIPWEILTSVGERVPRLTEKEWVP